jgi:hypothetical protein
MIKMSKEIAIPSEFIRGFILGGKSEFVLTNTDTGNRFAYKVEKKKSDTDTAGRGAYFVKYQYQYGHFAYAGLLIQRGESVFTWNQGAKGQCSSDAQCILVLLWFLKQDPSSIPDNMQCLHMGKCGRCGRALTDPDSIRTGLGPECRKKV